MEKVIKAVKKDCTSCGEFSELIIDGKVQIQGDVYHDDIDALIEGFIEGLNYCGKDVDFEKQEYTCPHCRG